jgi:hypothetical protein
MYCCSSGSGGSGGLVQALGEAHSSCRARWRLGPGWGQARPARARAPSPRPHRGPLACLRSPASDTPTSPARKGGINSFFRSSIQKLGLGGAGAGAKKAGGLGAQQDVSVVNPMFEEAGGGRDAREGGVSAADLVAVLSEASEVFSEGGEVGGFRAAAAMGEPGVGWGGRGCCWGLRRGWPATPRGGPCRGRACC